MNESHTRHQSTEGLHLFATLAVIHGAEHEVIELRFEISGAFLTLFLIIPIRNSGRLIENQ